MSDIDFTDFHETLIVLSTLHIPMDELTRLRDNIALGRFIGSLEPDRTCLWAGEVFSMKDEFTVARPIILNAHRQGADYVAFSTDVYRHPDLAIYTYRGENV